MNSMSRILRCALILLTATAVHVDWHLGRPTHIRDSLAWGEHWIFGLAFGFCLAAFIAWRNPERPPRDLVFVTAMGLFVGQIVEPLIETIFYDVSLSFVYPPERWILFAEFTAAFLLGSAVAWALVARTATFTGR